MKPLIGVTTYGRYDFEEETPRFCTPAAYCDAVVRAGGVPVLVPPCGMDFAVLAERLDGLLFIGGGDVEPARYGGQPHETVYMTDAERDENEIALARQAAASDVPTFCICRGAQVMNVALGGTLIEHLPDEVGEEVTHRSPPRKPAEHAVTVEPGSLLAAAVGDTACETVSWHHQALRKVADALKVVARAPDGTIEAVESPAHPWLLAVQWHPELAAERDAVQQGLFDRFVAAAADRMRQRRA